MKRLAALYDIHGNLPALEAVLEDVRRAEIDAILVGGDVFPGPMSGDVLDRLTAWDTPVHFLAGNGDRETLALAAGEEAESVPEQYRESMRWLARHLEPRHRGAMERWTATWETDVDGIGRVFFCHATPASDTPIFTVRTPDERLRPVFEHVHASVAVCGHTHMQFDRRLDNLRIVNAGSVGMPFGAPGAHWLLLGPDVQLRRTEYDLQAAAERIRGTGYPMAEEFATRFLLTPPSEEQILEAYGRVELK
jgi:predicted phosphodiesterase